MIHRFGDYELDPELVELRGPDGPVPVEPQVFDVLAHLVEHRDRVVPKEELLDEIWGDRFVSESALTSRLKSARRAVGDDGRRQEVIRTVHGRGYRFVAVVEPALAAAGSGGVAVAPPPDGVAITDDDPLPPVVPDHDIGWPLLGRQKEVTRLAELFHDPSVAGVLLSGPAGMGKTRLAQECAALAAEAGWPVARAHGHAEASTVPLACLAHLLPPGITDGSAADHDLARGALFQRAHQALEARAGGRRLLLMVDDVDRIDPLSRALLTGLVTAGAAFVVLTQRSTTEAVPAIEHLVKDGYVERVEVGPLPDDVLDVLLYRVLAGPIDRSCTRHLLDAANGSPGLLRQLVESAIERGVLVRRQNVWTLTGPLGGSVDLSTLVEHRVADLDDEQRRAAELLALAGRLELGLAEEVIGEDVLDGLDLHGLLVIESADGGCAVGLSSTLLAEQLLAEMRPLRARRLRVELADAIEASGSRRPGDELRLVRWRLESGGDVDVALLARTAQLALIEGDDVTAADLIDRLREADPSVTTIQLEAELQVRRGQMARADDFLASIDLDGLDEVAATQVLRRRVTNLYYGHWRFGDALDLLSANFDRFGDEGRRSLEAQWVMLAANQGRVDEALEIGERLLPDAEGLVRLELLRGVSMARALAGRLDDALAAVVEANEVAESVPDWLARVGRDHAVYNEVNILMELGRMDDARAVLDQETAGGRAQPGWIPFAAARLEYRAGNLEALERWLATPIEVARSVEHRYIEGLLRNMRALAALTRGDIGAAEAEAAQVEEIVDEVDGLVRLDMLDVLAAVQAAGGDVEGAVARLRVAAAEARRHGMLLVEQFALVRMAGLDPGAADLDRLDELAGCIDGDLATLRARHVRTVVDGGDLEEVAREYEVRGYLSAANRIRARR